VSADDQLLASQLETIWHREIPISAAMGIHVDDYDGGRLVVRAALSPNVNVHGTAFAGSLYAIAALCGWGITWLTLRKRALDAHIVIANGHIEYHRPVGDPIVASCLLDTSMHGAAFDKLVGTGKTRFPLVCRIGTGEAPDATFDGDYAVRLIRSGASASG
jgi:thioesterase domain-containing protein